ncbi:hypothetical protein B0H13DRAFT_2415804 [Mycena leptocephala]|nr:hypothetical protein B0H13DRAFT_2415804 [Mycena leptocephala]
MHVLQIVCYTAACTRAPLGLQHPSLLPRSRTAAGPNDDALWSATTGRVCTPRYLFTTLTPMRTCPSCVHLERAGVGDGMGMETEGCTQMVDWNMEVENEMKMEMGTAHSRISVEMKMKKRGCTYNADTALHARGRGRWRWRYRRRSRPHAPVDGSCACAWSRRCGDGSGRMFSPSPSASAPSSAPSSPSSSEAGFGFSFKALRYCMHTWARACTMDVDVGVVLPRFARGIRLMDAEKRMHRCRLAGYDSVRTSVEVGMKIPMFALPPHLHPPLPPALRYPSPAYLSISYRVYVSVPSTCATTEHKLGPFVHVNLRIYF